MTIRRVEAPRCWSTGKRRGQSCAPVQHRRYREGDHLGMRAHQEVLAAIQRISNDRVQGREGTGFNFCHDTSLDPESQGEPMRIAVIGGSTAGLASALRLRQSGHEVSVFERRSGTSTGGFGLLLISFRTTGNEANRGESGFVGLSAGTVEYSRWRYGRSILSQGLHDTVGI